MVPQELEFLNDLTVCIWQSLPSLSCSTHPPSFFNTLADFAEEYKLRLSPVL